MEASTVSVDDTATRSRDHASSGVPGQVVGLLVLAAAVGVTYLAVIMPGLPYDEPSHWLNVLYYLHHQAMPVVGDRGVSYEAVQGPLSYTVAALVAGAVRAGGGTLAVAFYAVRATSGIEFLLTDLVVWQLLGRLGLRRTSRLVALACFALNPMLLAMAWSVENDTLSLLLGFLALELALRWLDQQRPGQVQAAVVGAVLGLALLAKLTAWPLVLALPLWLVWRHGLRRAAALTAAVASGTVLTFGWWLGRNLAVYHGLLGLSAQTREGYRFPPYRINSLHAVGHIIEGIVTYLWVPDEYYRNLLHVYLPFKAVLLVVTALVAVVGGPIAFRRVAGRPATSLAEEDNVERQRNHLWHADGATLTTAPPDTTNGPIRSAWALLAVVAFVAVVGWVVLVDEISALAPRLGYMAWPCWLGMVGLAADQVVRWLTHRRPSVQETAGIDRVPVAGSDPRRRARRSLVTGWIEFGVVLAVMLGLNMAVVIPMRSVTNEPFRITVHRHPSALALRTAARANLGDSPTMVASGRSNSESRVPQPPSQ